VAALPLWKYGAAGDLTTGGAGGGAELLASQPFYVGINDVLTGDAMTHAAFMPDVLTPYSAWTGSTNAARAQIARGQALFNRKPIAITGVGGLNDALGVATIAGTCTTCHDSPNYGHHSVPLPIDIGLTDASRRTPDLPLYTLQNRTTGEQRQTTDPGRALVSGKWKDIGKMKGPILRGLAARAPYFHNGSAATLADAVNFYDTRFSIGFTPSEKADLVAFLQAL
jgi:cytochrome c peroxidase